MALRRAASRRNLFLAAMQYDPFPNRHCERSEAIQESCDERQLRDPWIVSSLRSSQ
jgi:hypothetical protein